MNRLKLPAAGGCQCGRVRYTLSAQPLLLYLCHCQDCRKQSASAFGMSMWVARESLKLTQGQIKRWTRLADSGRQVTCCFCEDCGSRLWHEPSRNPEIVNVKPGSLDDPSDLRPVGQVWMQRSLSWMQLPESLLCYEAQPENYEDLLQRWAETQITE